MALTQVSTGGVKDDAITKAKIPANQIEASELADNAVDTNAITDNAITSAKITDDAITQAKINVPITNKNLIINGAQLIAQRGTSSTSTGYQTIDRFALLTAGVEEAPTQHQVDIGSNKDPYYEGFRKAFKITNGNQTSADAPDHILIRYKVEAQDIANSGWNYQSATSYVTLSYWIRSSVAQNFYFNLIAGDGTPQNYAYETGALSANTWTKITKTISGNSNLTFNNDNGVGLQIDWWAYAGTNVTNSNVNLNQWFAYSSTNRMPNHTSTWFTTNDSTLEITGVQLELGSVATEFQHNSFADELLKCQRYYENVKGASFNNSQEVLVANGFNYTSNRVIGNFQFKVEKRARPSTSTDDASEVQVLKNNAGWYSAGAFGGNSNIYCTRLDCTSISTSPLTEGFASEIRLINDGIIHFDAEL